MASVPWIIALHKQETQKLSPVGLGGLNFTFQSAALANGRPFPRSDSELCDKELCETAHKIVSVFREHWTLTALRD